MNKGVPLTLALCCLWPLLVHVALTYGLRFITSRDWSRVSVGDLLSEIKLRWSKHQ